MGIASRALVLCLSTLLTAAPLAAQAAGGPSIDELVAQLTLEEKAALVTGRNAWETADVERLEGLKLQAIDIAETDEATPGSGTPAGPRGRDCRSRPPDRSPWPARTRPPFRR